MTKTWESIGEFFHSVLANQGDKRLQYVELEQRQQSMGTGVEGGFAVPAQFLGQIMAGPVDAIVRPRATVLPAGTPPDAAMNVPVLDDDAVGLWLGEGAMKQDTSFTLATITLTPHEFSISPTVTDKLLRNFAGGGPAIAAILQRGITKTEDRCFLSGTGVGQPLGILSAPATIHVGRDGAGAIVAADCSNMLARLLPGGEPVWLASPSAAASLGAIQDDSNGNILGRPVLYTGRLPRLGSPGDLMLVELSHYLIKDGSGPMVAISKDVPAMFLSDRAVVRVVWYTDGQPWLSAPVTPEGGGDPLSPFVMLN